MDAYLVCPWHCCHRYWLLVRRAINRNRTMACVAMLAAVSLCAMFYHVSGWWTIPNCRRDSYSFISDNSLVDLRIETALGRTSNDIRGQNVSLKAHFLSQMADTDVNMPEVAHNCRLVDHSGLREQEQGGHSGSECRPCARRPPISSQHLHKRGQILANTTSVSREELVAKYPDMEPGGRSRPRRCLPLQRLAIIIPYRNRQEHLNVLLNNLIPFCRRQHADVTFFVIEQEQSSVFNRGALMNVGFLAADKLTQFDCFIFHDVDLIPLNDRNLYRCGENPRHFAVALNKYGYKLLYEGYFGGVVGFTRQQYLDINGNSNLYFGWGGEDDDLILRSVSRGYYVSRYTVYTSRYDMITHGRDLGNDENPFREALLLSAIRRQDVEGLSTTKYTLIHQDFQHLYTWITVSINFTTVFKTAPAYTLRSLQKVDIQAKANSSRRHTATLTWYCVVLLVTCCSFLLRGGQCSRFRLRAVSASKINCNGSPTFSVSCIAGRF